MICPGLSILLAAAPAAERAEMTPYVIVAGDTYASIADRGLKRPCAIEEVQRLNHLPGKTALSAGQTIVIPRALLREQATDATFEGLSGRVGLHTPFGATTARAGEVVHEGAIVETGANSSARLKLQDGSRVTIPSNSRVRLDRLRRVTLTGAPDRAITVLAGGADSNVVPRTDRSGRFVVTTPVAVSAVRGTVFRVAYDPVAREGSAGVLRGSVDVSGGERRVLPKEGEGVTATPAGVSDPKALLPPPNLSGAARVQKGEAAGFDILPRQGALGHHILIAADADFLRILSDKRQTAGHVPVSDLPDGDYFAAVTDLASGGLEGQPTAYSFTRQGSDLVAMAVREERGRADRGYTFTWRLERPVTGATYRFSLMRLGTKTSVEDRTGLTAPRAETVNLPEGIYAWTVTASWNQQGRNWEVSSDPQQLTVSRKGD